MNIENADAGFARQLAAAQEGLRDFKESIQKRVEGKMVRVGLQVFAKSIKAKVPSDQREIKKLIGYRLAKRKTGQDVSGKVGAAVGSAGRVGTGKGATFKMKKTKDRTGRPGVGIGARNVHWFIMGTKQRFRGVKTIRDRKTGEVTLRIKTGARISTGRMPPQVPGIIQAGIKAGYRPALQKMAEVGQKETDKEAAKLRAKIQAAQ